MAPPSDGHARADPSSRALRRETAGLGGLHSAFATLTDWQDWRQAGRHEHRFAVRAMSEWPVWLVAVRLVSAVACGSTGIAGALLLWHPSGPHGVVGRTVLVALLLGCLVVAGLWLLCPFPGWTGAVAYVAWADLTILGVALMLSDPVAKMCVVILLSTVGTFAGWFLGWRIMLLHCLFCAAVIIGTSIWALCQPGTSAWSLYLVTGTAVVVDVLMPALLQFPVEVIRRSVVAVARRSNCDPLTGLLNRRGLRSAAD